MVTVVSHVVNDMARSGRYPLHITKQRNVCFARVTIPPPLQPIFGGKRFFKASTGEADPFKAAAKAAPWIADWKHRIEQARAAAEDSVQARMLKLTSDFARYRKEPLDAAGRRLVMEALSYAVERTGGQLIPMLTHQPNARLALPAPALAIVDQVTGKATPFLTHLARWQQETHLRGAVLQAYTRDIKQFAEAVSEPLETLSRRHVYKWAVGFNGTLNPSTIRRKIISLSAYWRWLDKNELVSSDLQPFKGIEIDDPRSGAKRREAKRISWPTKVVPTLWQAAEARGDAMLAALIRIAAYSGGRIESIANLTVADVRTDPDTDIRFLHFADKTEAGVRDVPMHSAMILLVDDLIANAGKNGYLFPVNLDAERRGNAAGRRFTDLKREMGFTDKRLVFHSLRRTIAHLLETAQCPEGVAKDIVGHVKRDLTFGLYSGETPIDLRKMWLERAVVYPI